jgi:hypothetical protein
VVSESLVNREGLRAITSTVEQGYPSSRRSFVVGIELSGTPGRFNSGDEITFLESNRKLGRSLLRNISGTVPLPLEPLFELVRPGEKNSRQQFTLIAAQRLSESAGGEIIAHRGHICLDHFGRKSQLIIPASHNGTIRQMTTQCVDRASQS